MNAVNIAIVTVMATALTKNTVRTTLMSGNRFVIAEARMPGRQLEAGRGGLKSFFSAAAAMGDFGRVVAGDQRSRPNQRRSRPARPHGRRHDLARLQPWVEINFKAATPERGGNEFSSQPSFVGNSVQITWPIDWPVCTS